jgi:hypothetical protein
MWRDLARGGIAGLIGAAIAGVLLQNVSYREFAGVHITLMAIVGRIAYSNSPVVSWLEVLVYGAAIGLLFGRIVRGQTLTFAAAIIGGALYGIGWWILSSILVVPALTGEMPLSALAVDQIRSVAVPTMIISAVYGVVLGSSLIVLRGSRPRQSIAT